MTKYMVTVRTTYVQEMEIEACDEIEAKQIAMKEFYPDPDFIFSMDVFGLDPWRPIDDAEDRAYEKCRQEELDNEA